MKVNVLGKGHLFLILTEVLYVLAADWPEAEFGFLLFFLPQV